MVDRSKSIIRHLFSFTYPLNPKLNLVMTHLPPTLIQSFNCMNMIHQTLGKPFGLKWCITLAHAQRVPSLPEQWLAIFCSCVAIIIRLVFFIQWNIGFIMSHSAIDGKSYRTIKQLFNADRCYWVLTDDFIFHQFFHLTSSKWRKLTPLIGALLAQGTRGAQAPFPGHPPIDLTLLVGPLALFTCFKSLLLLFPLSSCLVLPHVLHHEYQDLGARSHDMVV